MAIRKICLKGIGTRNEYTAAIAITPGMLLDLTSASEVTPHGSEGGNAIPRFAVEEDFLGREISDAYSAGDRVQTETYSGGDQVGAYVSANTAAIAIGDEIVSNGDGGVRAVAAGSPAIGNEAVIGVALSAAPSSAAAQWVVVEIA